MSRQPYEPVGELTSADGVKGFDCGRPALNQFLQRFAPGNQLAHSAQTYVCCNSGEVVGFYSLAVGSVAPASPAPRVIKGMPQHTVPMMILRGLQWIGSIRARDSAARYSRMP